LHIPAKVDKENDGYPDVMSDSKTTETFVDYASASLVPFEPLRFLGHGSFACVEEVRHTSDGAIFARKSIRVLAYQAANITEAVEREVAIIRKLRHAHVISIHDVYREPKSIGIIMSPVADGDLDWFFERCTDEGFSVQLLSLLRVWFACLSEALVYIHGQNIRHKDIKPGNILVRNELVYFTDFGLARDFDSSMTSSTEGCVLGKTPTYSPPEVISEGKRGRSADIFSLGCVFAEMETLLSKRSIVEFVRYRAKDGTHAYHATLDKVAHWFGGSACYGNFIGRMLSLQPKERPSAAEIQRIINYGGVDGALGLICRHHLNRSFPEPQDLVGVTEAKRIKSSHLQLTLGALDSQGQPASDTLPNLFAQDEVGTGLPLEAWLNFGMEILDGTKPLCEDKNDIGNCFDHRPPLGGPTAKMHDAIEAIPGSFHGSSVDMDLTSEGRSLSVETLTLDVGNTYCLVPLEPWVDNRHHWTFFIRPSRTDVIENVKFNCPIAYLTCTSPPYEIGGVGPSAFTIIAQVTLRTGYVWDGDGVCVIDDVWASDDVWVSDVGPFPDVQGGGRMWTLKWHLDLSGSERSQRHSLKIRSEGQEPTRR
ncbi:hypothetical protein GP486_008003, partial [Trichoglossum hirsutum]